MIGLGTGSVTTSSPARLDPYEAPPPDSSDAVRFVHAMTDEHLGIMVDIVCLERDVEGARGAGRAGAALGRAVVDLCAIRDAAGAVVLDASLPELGELFQPDAPLGVYLTGLLLWTRGVVWAMRLMAVSVAEGRAAWHPTKRRIDRAGTMHLSGLADDSFSHVEQLCRDAHAALDPPAVARLVAFQRGLRRLVTRADELARTLHESFTPRSAE